MSTITRERAAGIAKGEKCYTHDDVVELARIALASLELERGMIRRFDLDMSDCDSCGQDCGADMVEDLDGEYVLWDEVLPYLYRYDEYTAPPVPASVPDEIEPTVEAIKRVLPTSNPDEYAACIGADMWNACRAAMLQGAYGNSPVVPDGWVMVPVEPTAEMLQSGISAHYERSQIQIHDRPAPGPMECAYVAMLAAAPQQEAKNV